MELYSLSSVPRGIVLGLLPKVFLLTALLVFSGCDAQYNRMLVTEASEIASDANLAPETFKIGKFTIKAWLRHARGSKETRVYFEGDGCAWVEGGTSPSSDPTPINPIGLKLASVDLSKSVVYLSRPGQYETAKITEQKYWTSHRFSPEVILAYQVILRQLKARLKAKKWHFLGYSGGAAIALLVASKTQNIAQITTFAGNFAPHEWTNCRSLSQLSGSLSPMNFTKKLRKIQQIHYVGAKDDVISLQSSQSYIHKLKGENSWQLIKVADFQHDSSWHVLWRELCLN